MENNMQHLIWDGEFELTLQRSSFVNGRTVITYYLTDHNNDRDIYLEYARGKVIGLNFCQGIGDLLAMKLDTPNVHLTEIFNRLYTTHTFFDIENQISHAISLYFIAFIDQGLTF